MKFKAHWLGLPVADREAFAKRCKTSIGHLRNIAYGDKPCGESLAIAIERESQRSVTCEELRPDVDWAYLRGTASRSSSSAHPA
jgi:DNA-binding transcriptional regulator YdaS (Cro superfamily)